MNIKILFLAAIAASSAFVSCSSGSGSGTSAGGGESDCILASALPASSVVYSQNLFGCSAAQTLGASDMTTYDAALVAAGFTKKAITTESASYTKNLDVDSALVLTISYTGGNFAGNLLKEAREYTYGDLSKVAENFGPDQILALEGIVWMDHLTNNSLYSIEKKLTKEVVANYMNYLQSLGWTTQYFESSKVYFNAYLIFNGSTYNFKYADEFYLKLVSN